MIKFSNSETESKANGIKLMVYGPAGMGKTVLTATLPNPVMISAESGALSLRRKNLERLFGENNPLICYNVPMIVIENVNDLSEAFRWCTESNEAKQFESISLDSVTEIAEQVLANAKLQVKDPRQAYGELVEKMMTTIKSFRDIRGKHVCLSAKQSRFTDEISKVTRFGPEMPGQRMGPAAPYLVDEVFALRVGKNTDGSEFRYLQTQPDLQYDCKDRSGACAVMEYPHLGAIINKIISDGA